MKDIYVIAWKYHNNNDSSYDEDGVVETAYTDEGKAQAHILKCAEGDFNELLSEGGEPKMTHDPDYAKVEDANECYEYKIVKVYVEEQED